MQLIGSKKSISREIFVTQFKYMHLIQQIWLVSFLNMTFAELKMWITIPLYYRFARCVGISDISGRNSVAFDNITRENQSISMSGTCAAVFWNLRRGVELAPRTIGLLLFCH